MTEQADDAASRARKEHPIPLDIRNPEAPDDDAKHKEQYLAGYADKPPKPEGVFECHGKTLRYDRRSLFCFDRSFALRKGLVWFIEWKWFDNFITLVILLNSFMLAAQDYQGRLEGEDYISVRNNELEKVDLVFTVIFIMECVLKIIGMGFIVHRNSYLRDPWNWLDFFVVCISIAGFFPSAENEGLKALRTFRILRPLRSINAMPRMRALIQSLLASIPGLANVLFFLAFTFAIFAIFGVQSFAGNQYQRCRMTEEAIVEYNDAGELINYEWPVVEDFDWLCLDDAMCEKYIKKFGPEDLTVYKCGSSFQEYNIKVGGKLNVDDPGHHELIVFDIVNFNNMGSAMINIFQVLTLEGWTDMMYNYMDANNVGVSIFFFVSLVIFGSFFTLNLVLAEIMESFQRQSELKEAEDAAKAAEEESKRKEEEREARYENELARQKEAEEAAARAENETVRDGAPPADGDAAGDQPLDSNRGLLPKDDEKNVNILEDIDEKQEAKKEPVKHDELIDNKQVPADDEEEEGEIDYSAFEDEEWYEANSRRRAKGNCCVRCFYVLVTNPVFNFFIFMMILANTISLAADDYPQSLQKEQILAWCNEFFTWIFFFEMILKIIGLGFDNYRRDAYNLFDLVVVVISLIDWTIAKTIGDNVGSFGEALQAFRAMRLLRIIKLARSWTALQDILKKTLKSLQDIAIFCMLLGLFMYILALLGMEFFANKARFDLDEVIIPAEEIVERYLSGEPMSRPRENFDAVQYALTSIFVVILGEDWNWVMYYHVLPFGENGKLFIGYFVTLFILGNIVLLSLFTAILLQNFEGGDPEEEEAASKAPSGIEDDGPQRSMTQKLFSKDTGDKIKEEIGSMFGVKKRKYPDEVRAQMEREADEKANEDVNASAGPPSGAEGIKEPGDKRTTAKVEEERDAEKPFSEEPFGRAYNSQEAESVALETEGGKAFDKKLQSIGSKLSQRNSSVLLHYQDDDDEGPAKEVVMDYDDIEGRSLFLFGKLNPLRGFMAFIAKNKHFDRIILLLICISTINLALESPLDDPESLKLEILEKIDWFMTAAFTLEMSIKILAFGFIINGKHSYLRSGWNCLDFVIVMSALLSLNPNAFEGLSSLKTLRILRILRPLKLISKNKGLKVAITALFKSLPAIANLQLIVVFFLFLFGILHTTLFAGKFYRCETGHLDLSFDQVDQLIVTRFDCLNYGGEWYQPDLHFDTTLQSMLTLFTIQSTEGWIGVMWDEVDAVAVDHIPVENIRPYYIIFAILVLIIITLLFLNLFVGVVIETFNSEKEILSKNDLLKKQQKTWINVQIMAYSAKPVLKQQMTGNFFRDSIIAFCDNAKFDGFIMACIIGNTIVLMIKWYGMAAEIIEYVQYVNYVFMVIFTVEAVLKIIAFRGNYFKDSWNIFDFTVVVGTAVVLVIGFFDLGDFAIQSTILRSLRIGRILRIVKRAKKLQVIFKTLAESAPSMGSLGLLLLLLLFMYAIIGMGQFAFVNITDQEGLHYHANFQSFRDSFLLLMRCSTGEAWNMLMFDSARPQNIMFQCENEFGYEDYAADNFTTNKCGPTALALFYFISFQIIISQIFLNLFIAIIVDSFLGQAESALLPVQPIDIDAFCDTWKEFDGEAKGFIDCCQLEDFFIKLSENSQCELILHKTRMVNNASFRRRFIANLEVPTFKGFRCVQFYDILLALIKNKCEHEHNRDRIVEDKKKFKVLSALKNVHHGDESLSNMAKEEIMNDEENCQYQEPFDDVVGGLTYLDRRIDLLQDLQMKAKQIAKKRSLSADESKSPDHSMYYTTKHYVFGTYIVSVWRENIKILQAEKDAGYGEYVNGRRKIMPSNPNQERISKKTGATSTVVSPEKRGDGLAAINEVEGSQEQSVKDRPIAQVMPFGEAGRIDPAINSAIEVDGAEMDELDESQNVNTVFHNDKKNFS